MKHFSFSSLRLRIILLVLLALMPAWGTMLYSASEQRRLAALEIQKDTFMLAEFAARVENQLFQGTRQALIALATFLSIRDSNPVECNAFVASLLKQFRRYANVGAVKPNGDLFCSARPFDGSANASDQAWFKRAIETRDFTIGDYQIGRTTGEASLVLACPALDLEGQIQAVFFAAIDLEWLNRFNFDVKKELPEGSTFTQIDENGIILAHNPDPGQWVGRSIVETSPFKTILSQKKGLLAKHGHDGIPRIYGFATLKSALREREAYVILSIPQRVAFADSRRILIQNLILSGIVAVLAIVAAWLVGDLFILRQVKALVNGSKQLAAGDLSVRIGHPKGSEELSQLSRAFDEMAAMLEQREIERAGANEEIKRSREQLRTLATHLQTVREEERTRIAREIHDDLGQALTALKMDLSWLSNRMSKDQKTLLEKTRKMWALIDVTIQTVHRLSSELRPGILDDLGLPAAIEWQAEEFQNRTGIKLEVVFNPEQIDLNKEQSTAIFRIFQEILTNIIRHANATKVEVSLEEKDRGVTLDVADNGRGIREEEISDPKSFGLTGMRERVHPWGGEVHISGVQGEGTKIRVSIPADRKEKSDGKNNYS